MGNGGYSVQEIRCCVVLCIHAELSISFLQIPGVCAMGSFMHRGVQDCLSHTIVKIVVELRRSLPSVSSRLQTVPLQSHEGVEGATLISAKVGQPYSMPDFSLSGMVLQVRITERIEQQQRSYLPPSICSRPVKHK